MNTDTDTDDVAEYSDYTPGCALFDVYRNPIVTLPLGAWAQLCAWHRDPNARPLMYRDEVGGIARVDRSAVTMIMRRDLDAVVTLEAQIRDAESERLKFDV